MTIRAREVLADCEQALADSEASANTPFQRSRWVALITLLRTVGLVLKAVDRPVATSAVQQRIDDAWQRLKHSKPEPRIFHDFIDAERYQAVHLYEIRSAANVTVRPGVGTLGWAPVVAGASSGFGFAAARLDFFMKGGPFKGQDPCELCRKAIAFWLKYLDSID